MKFEQDEQPHDQASNEKKNFEQLKENSGAAASHSAVIEESKVPKKQRKKKSKKKAEDDGDDVDYLINAAIEENKQFL